MIVKINLQNPQERLLRQAVETLLGGGLIAYPTDTTYAIGCDLYNLKGIGKIYTMKRRPLSKPFSFICHDLKNISEYAQVGNYAYKVMKRLLPGPYTFVLESSKQVPKILQTRRRTVGIRVPDHPIALELVRLLGHPIISTSASLPDSPVESDPYEIEARFKPRRKTITVHRQGEFTGDISHLTGLPAVVSGIARGDCEVYEITGDALRQVLNQCPAISDIILQAFIARRQLLRESPNFTGLRVIGSRYSPDTFRVRDFLSKNRILFTWVDIETDPNVDRLLRQFGVTESDTPVVACGSMLLLRNPSNRQLADAIGIRQPLGGPGVRPGGCGRRSGGSGGRRLWRLRRAEDRRARTHRARRPSRQQYANRKLPWLSHRLDGQ